MYINIDTNFDSKAQESSLLSSPIIKIESMFYLKSVPGKVTDQVALSQWVKSNCVPVVREITFENGEELTEEGNSKTRLG